MQNVIAALKAHSRFLITAHVNPEGDSLGSQLAMKALVETLGKQAVIVDNDPVPGNLKFLPGASEILNDVVARPLFDAALVLDCPTIKRIGRVKEVIGNAPIINIDHHISNERFGSVNWVDADASSSGEMVYRIFRAMSLPISKDAALSLYVAILTDTGSFNYDNTSRATHEMAGELLGYGFSPADVSEKVYEHRSLADIRLLGLALATLKVTSGGEIAYIEVTKKMLDETALDPSKTEGFVNYPRSIDGTKVAILFREDISGSRNVNVSFRAKGGVDVNKIASAFGGGGHVKASGCVIEGALGEVQKRVLARVEEALRA